jgi:hypothetical protein
VERRGLTERKPFQQENSCDTEHGKPSFRFGKVRMNAINKTSMIINGKATPLVGKANLRGQVR